MSTLPVSPASIPADRSTSKTELISQEALKQHMSQVEDASDDAPIDAPNMVERDGALFRADPADKKMDGPFCIRCFKKTGKLVPVLPMPETFAMSASAEWDCGACKLVP